MHWLKRYSCCGKPALCTESGSMLHVAAISRLRRAGSYTGSGGCWQRQSHGLKAGNCGGTSTALLKMPFEG